MLEQKKVPSPQALNKLLAHCKEETHPPDKLALALKRSEYAMSILEEKTGQLVGFVRVTSDRGLNANLWNLVAQPGPLQDQFLSYLLQNILGILKRELPGCSISVSASGIAVKALRDQGFLVDPGGIRAMGFQLRQNPYRRWILGTIKR